ncbi:hypothetical protein LWI29_001933 [Acer saccharum]|uniref:Bidirectional sugar transporter SWEET n=1 Tax=Acer saccharum TaxID=4024 RepID=A0AA39SZC9_ACESA|nr:hypothetical protein LWI29_001933 [Acer saccharum]
MSTSLWTFYGLLKPGGFLVMTVNGAGVVSQFTYITLFLIYAPREKKIKTAKLAVILDVGFLGAVFAITLLAMHKLSLRLTFVGIISAGLTVGVYASPLLIMVPNAIGFVLGSSQLILYAIYKNKSMSTKSTDVMEEKYGSAHPIKQSIEMQVYDHDNDFDDDGNKVMDVRNLNRGASLPKSSINQQYSLRKLIRTVSLGPYDVFPNWSDDAISNVKRNIDDDLP